MVDGVGGEESFLGQTQFQTSYDQQLSLRLGCSSLEPPFKQRNLLFSKYAYLEYYNYYVVPLLM